MVRCVTIVIGSPGLRKLLVLVHPVVNIVDQNVFFIKRLPFGFRAAVHEAPLDLIQINAIDVEFVGGDRSGQRFVKTCTVDTGVIGSTVGKFGPVDGDVTFCPEHWVCCVPPVRRRAIADVILSLDLLDLVRFRVRVRDRSRQLTGHARLSIFALLQDCHSDAFVFPLFTHLYFY